MFFKMAWKVPAACTRAQYLEYLEFILLAIIHGGAHTKYEMKSKLPFASGSVKPQTLCSVHRHDIIFKIEFQNHTNTFNRRLLGFCFVHFISSQWWTGTFPVLSSKRKKYFDRLKVVSNAYVDFEFGFQANFVCIFFSQLIILILHSAVLIWK